MKNICDKFLAEINLTNASKEVRLCALEMLYISLKELSKIKSNRDVIFSDGAYDITSICYKEEDIETFLYELVKLTERWSNDLQYILVQECCKNYKDSVFASPDLCNSGSISAYDIIYEWLDTNWGISFNN